MSDSTSITSVSDLLGSPVRRSKSHQANRDPIDVQKWAQDSIISTGVVHSPSSDLIRAAAGHDDELHSTDVLQLKLDVANSALAEYKTRSRQLEAELRELRAKLEEGHSSTHAAKSSQALLLERIQELEAQLSKSAESEQAKAAQLARLESRAAVAEGSLRAAEQQVSQALTELQAQRSKELGDLHASHTRELQQLQDQHAAAAAQLKAGYEDKIAELAKAARVAEQVAQKEQARSKDAVAQLEKECSKGVAVKELMRHSEELQGQVERLQGALQEERRRANKVAQSAESTLAAEKHLAEVSAQELQIKMQDATQEQAKAVRAAKAKLQRAETDLRGARQQARQLAARVQELESLNAKKDLQLNTASGEVAAMQRELQALRHGLSGREAASLEAARTQFMAALEACQADLLVARQQASEQTLLAQRQGAALGSITNILAAHVDGRAEVGAAGELQAGTARLPSDPEKVVAFVEAVSSTLLDLQQQWELERQEMSQALGSADAVHVQLDSLLQQEREEGRRLAGEMARLDSAAQMAHEKLQTAERRLAELEDIHAAQGATEQALNACRAELTMAAAKAVAHSEECSKWRGAAEALEAQLQQATLAAEASQLEAVELKSLAAAKDERIKEMRNAMASAMDDKSSTASDLQRKLARLQHAEHQLEECRAELARYTPAAAAAAQVAAEAAPKLRSLLQALEAPECATERLGLMLSAGLKPALAALQSLAAPEGDPSSAPASLSSAVLHLCDGLGHVAQVLHERGKIRHILSTVNAKLKAATSQHRSLLTAGEKGVGLSQDEGTSLVTLLQQLTESVVGLIESLAVEKECIASEMMHVAEENQLLQSQIHSMQSVLASLQSDSNVEQQLAETLISWNQAQAHIAGLEADNASLAQRLQQAQQAVDNMRSSSTQEWAGMRDDIARLVQHAEQAQLDAEAAVQHVQAECDDKVDRLRQEAEKAATGKVAAEAVAADLGRQLKAVQEQLAQRAQVDGEVQDNVQMALHTAQQGMHHLEVQVAQLQRKLVLKAKSGLGMYAVKKAVAAGSKVMLLKRENERLKQQEKELGEKVASLEGTIRQGSHQLKQSREQAAASQAGMSDAQAKVARLEALLRKVDERKASVEVERKKAQEAAARLEQQVLELQCKLETTQHRERMAQADAEQMRAALTRREQEVEHLSGAVQQVEVAESVLRDSHATASKLLQECTELKRSNHELHGQVTFLSRQLQDTQQGHTAAQQQLHDLQEAFDTALTELDIARSLLGSQRQQAAVPPSRQEARQPEFSQRIVAYPATAVQQFPGEQQAMEQLMRSILGSKNIKLAGAGCTRPLQPGCQPAEQAGSRNAAAHPSPFTQQHVRTPSTPLTSYQGNCASAPHMADDASSHRPTPEPNGTCAPPDENSRPQSQAASGPAASHASQQASAQQPAAARPDSAASAASQALQVDVVDMRGLVLAVESLQRQLAVKSDRIKELRGALQQQAVGDAGARPGSAGASAEAFVLQQKLEAKSAELESVRALCGNLEAQLGEAQQAKLELHQQLSAATAMLSAMAGAPQASAEDQWQQQQQGLGVEPALRQHLVRFEQQLGALEQQVAASQAELAQAQARADDLAVELAERDAMVEALHVQVATAAGARSTAGTQTEEGEVPITAAAVVAAARATSRPSSRAEDRPASAQASGALSSLDRIVGLWKRACTQKDRQIKELQGRLGEAHDALAAAEAGHEALQHQVQDSAVALHNLDQLLTEAQLELAAARSREQDLSSRVSHLETDLQACQEDMQSYRQDLQEARRQHAGAERHSASLQQQLEIAQAQVREVQHATQLERASHGDADALRHQLASARVELDMASEAAAAAQQRAGQLEQQLQKHKEAAAAAAASSATSSQLSHQLEVAREAERRLLREAQDAGAQLAAAQQEAGELRHAVAVRDAQLRQVLERLEGSEAQLQEALGAVHQQNEALQEMQVALEQMRDEQQQAAAVSMEQEAAAATASRQELALMQQRLEVAERQMEVLRAQLSHAEGDRAAMVAEKRRLQAQETRLSDVNLRYQAGLHVLTSALRQLQSADAEGGLDMLAMLGHYQGAGTQQTQQQGAAVEAPLSVEELVDEILFHVHRRDCDISALLAQVSQLEAAVASKTSDISEQQGRLQTQLGSIARVKEQLQWCMRECEALKHQLADKDEQIARLKAAAAAAVAGASGGDGSLGGLGTGGGGRSGGAAARGAGLGGWTSLQRKQYE